jgi:hypothetical protein
MKSTIVERNLDAVTSVMRFILAQPEILNRLPQDFRLVILPDDDPELSHYNLDLLADSTQPEKSVVIVRLGSISQSFNIHSPQVFVPVLAS